jgi:GDP-L-fucose synthase
LNLRDKRIYIAGHGGMVGSSVLRTLRTNGCANLLTRELHELDLTRQQDVEKFFESEKPELVIVAAARVGGIYANNTYRAEFIYQNLMIEANVIHCAHLSGVRKLIFLGSSCIYPKLAPQPLKEEYLLTSELEFTNEPYAIAKIAGIKMCENYYRQYGDNFYSVMPTNMYGPFDNYDLRTSHVFPALIRKIHEAKIRGEKSIEVWGTGGAYREFMYVDDLSEALLFLLGAIDAKDLYENGIVHLNIGTGEDLTISELVRVMSDVIGYPVDILYDSSKPDGTPRKIMDVSRMHALGWKHQVALQEGIRKSYEWFLENRAKE